jgi:SPP1 family phage portal protein
MKLSEILDETDKAKQVEKLKKGRLAPEPDTVNVLKEWDPKQHHIFNAVDRPDKTVYYEVIDDNQNAKTLSRIEKVARIPLAVQKLIVRRAVSFLFGNPVKAIASQENSSVAAAVDRVLRDNKQASLNRNVARELFASTEVAECWYVVTTKNKFSTYGFETDMKLRCRIFSPLKGDKLYPFFNELGDMEAFSREYKVKENNEDVPYFETWTAETYFRYKKQGDGWVDALEGGPKQLVLGKIPVIYARQEQVEWNDVQSLIERLEKLISNFGDTNDYHGSPKIAVAGKVSGFSKKGESGGILELEDGASAEYLAWDQAPESIKLEFDNLLRMIFSLTQTPDISFDAVKGLGSAASGQSLKMLFLDAHLKVMDKMEIFDDYLQRRLNILKAFIGKMNTAWSADADKLELTPEIIPYMVNDERDKIDNLVTATTGGIMSKKTAVSHNPLVEDVVAELTLLEAEERAANESAAKLDDIMNGI